ncbi:hypothetical protein [Halobacillus salinus]|uniref:hypothetical protein n=1 Tax=Halobacillus salinus TaxID=192814 RepID=UPI0009A72EF1|nr:hypothetical protein [Halobacillus salinus]
MAKTEVIKFNDFMQGKTKTKKKKRVPYAATAPLALIPFTSNTAFAATDTVYPAAIPANAVGDAIKGRIADAFDPLVEVMVAVSLPVASVMVTGGALLVMIGMNDKGYGLLMKAGIGYCLVQMSPLFIDLLAGVGEAI